MSKGVFTKTIVAVFPRGPKRGNPTMTITARRKGDPQHILREQIKRSKDLLPAFWFSTEDPDSECARAETVTCVFSFSADMKAKLNDSPSHNENSDKSTLALDPGPSLASSVCHQISRPMLARYWTSNSLADILYMSLPSQYGLPVVGNINH